MVYDLTLAGVATHFNSPISMPIDFDYPLAAEIDRNVAAALAEDIGPGDLTASLIPAERVARATVISREAGVLCGRAWFDRCVISLDPNAEITWSAADGDRITANQLLCEINAHARALLFPARWPEPLSRVLLEAASVGCPVVATPTGGRPPRRCPGSPAGGIIAI